MVNEYFTDFKSATLLKKHGFDCEVWHYFMNEEANFWMGPGKEDWNHLEEGNNLVSAPTLQMAFAWIREKYNIHIVPLYDFYGGSYSARIYDGRRSSAYDIMGDYSVIVACESYEAAGNEAIVHVLEKMVYS